MMMRLLSMVLLVLVWAGSSLPARAESAPQAADLDESDKSSSESSSLRGAIPSSSTQGKKVAIADSSQRPLVVFIDSSKDKDSPQVRKLVDDLEKDYDGKATFITLDSTTVADRKKSEQIAKSYGIQPFFTYYSNAGPGVGIFNAKRHCVKEIFGAGKKEQYTKALEKVLTKG